MSTFDVLVNYREGLLQGLAVTLKMSFLIWTVGIVLGTAFGVAGAHWPRLVGLGVRVGAFILSGAPILVFLFWLNYPLQAMLRIVVDPFVTAVTTLSIINVFMVADQIFAVIRDFPEQYLVAARVCGLPSRTTFWQIQIPILLRQAIPGLLNLQIAMLQSTIFASLISVDEIFRVAQRINAQAYRPVEIYTALALFFLAICLPVNGLAIWLRSRFTRDLSER
jgi:ABC-type amino acid transport system permease subunit